MSEKMTPTGVAQLLNRYFGAMIDVIFENEGSLDKFIGDAILATFGAALHQEDHGLRCVRTALDMQRALAIFNAKDENPELRIRIAINSGSALVGDIGSPSTTVVNRRSRREQGVSTP